MKDYLVVCHAAINEGGLQVKLVPGCEGPTVALSRSKFRASNADLITVYELASEKVRPNQTRYESATVWSEVT